MIEIGSVCLPAAEPSWLSADHDESPNEALASSFFRLG
jgi:hypothetical protein